MVAFIPLSGWYLTDLAIILFAIYIVSATRSYLRLRHVPGPVFWAWSVLPLFRCHLRGDIYEQFLDFARQYGPVVRVAPNTVLVSDPEVLRRMSAARSPYTRSDWYLAMRLIPGKDNVLSTRDDKRHDELRRKMASGYSGKENPTLERDIDECVLDLINLIKNKYASSTPTAPMDLARKIQFFTSDVMSKIAFDAKFNDLHDDADNFGYIHEIDTIFPSIFCVCTIPAVINFFTHLGFMKLFAPSVNSTFGLGKVLAITRAQVAKRFNPDGQPNKANQKDDMLGSFIRHGLTQSEAEQESVLQLAAGSDTTATAIRATLLCIITNPRVHTKLLAELDAASGPEGSLGGLNSDAIISDQQAKTLPYLQACIKEGLRWHPPIAGMLSKKVPAPSGDTICNFPLPAGVSVGYSVKAVHWSPGLYGPDENVYRPERWLLVAEGGDESDPEKLRIMERNNELIFGSGRYQCLGKTVASVELNKVVAELVRRFEWQVVNTTRPWVSRCYGIHLQSDLWVAVREREEGRVRGGE
jgi:cytochrome P450